MHTPDEPHQSSGTGTQSGIDGLPATDAAKLYRAMIEGLGWMVLLLDREQRIAFCSRALNDWLAACSLTEVRAGTVLADAMPELSASFFDTVQASFASLQPSSREEHFIVDARRSALRVTMVPLDVGDGRFLLVHLENIGVGGLQAEELIAQRNLEAIGQLAGGIAHDFNNLMTTVFGHIEMARLHADPQGRERLHLDRAFAAASEAKELTGQLITFSIGGDPITEAMPLVGLLEDVCRFACRSFPVRCQLEVPPDLWLVWIDRQQVDQALHNIVLNACEAMSTSGKLVISAENEGLAGGATGVPPGGECVRVMIRDNGCGIDAENLPRVFDPYFTTKRIGGERGTGLGLTIAHSIIRKHHGTIKVQSAPGAGTTVIVRLPAMSGNGGGE